MRMNRELCSAATPGRGILPWHRGALPQAKNCFLTPVGISGWGLVEQLKRTGPE
jgi:hypothetical protein